MTHSMTDKARLLLYSLGQCKNIQEAQNAYSKVEHDITCNSVKRSITVLVQFSLKSFRFSENSA